MGFLNSSDALIDTFTYELGFIDSFRMDTEKGRLVLNCISLLCRFSRTVGRKDK